MTDETPLLQRINEAAEAVAAKMDEYHAWLEPYAERDWVGEFVHPVTGLDAHWSADYEQEEEWAADIADLGALLAGLVLGRDLGATPDWSS